jgi:hypothetical protein
MTCYPWRGTYKKSRRARKEHEIVFYALNRSEAFAYLLRVTERETFGDGVPGFVDALTCEEAHARQIPFVQSVSA